LPRSFEDRNFLAYIISKIIIFFALCYSAFSSFGYYYGTMDLPYEIRIVIAVLMSVFTSLLIGYLTSSILTLFRSSGLFAWFQIFALFPLLVFNVYADWQGVKEVGDHLAENNSEVLSNTAKISHYSAIKELNADWADGKKKDWAKHTIWQDANKELSILKAEQEKINLKYSYKAKRLTDGLRGGVSVCILIIVALSIWCNYYEYKVVLDSNKTGFKDKGITLKTLARQAQDTAPKVNNISFNEDTLQAIEDRLNGLDKVDEEIVNYLASTQLSYRDIAKKISAKLNTPVSKDRVMKLNKELNIK